VDLVSKQDLDKFVTRFASQACLRADNVVALFGAVRGASIEFETLGTQRGDQNIVADRAFKEFTVQLDVDILGTFGEGAVSSSKVGGGRSRGRYERGQDDGLPTSIYSFTSSHFRAEANGLDHSNRMLKQAAVAW